MKEKSVSFIKGKKQISPKSSGGRGKGDGGGGGGRGPESDFSMENLGFFFQS